MDTLPEEVPQVEQTPRYSLTPEVVQQVTSLYRDKLVDGYGFDTELVDTFIHREELVGLSSIRESNPAEHEAYVNDLEKLEQVLLALGDNIKPIIRPGVGTTSIEKRNTALSNPDVRKNLNEILEAKQKLGYMPETQLVAELMRAVDGRSSAFGKVRLSDEELEAKAEGEQHILRNVAQIESVMTMQNMVMNAALVATRSDVIKLSTFVRLNTPLLAKYNVYEMMRVRDDFTNLLSSIAAADTEPTGYAKKYLEEIASMSHSGLTYLLGLHDYTSVSKVPRPLEESRPTALAVESVNTKPIEVQPTIEVLPEEVHQELEFLKNVIADFNGTWLEISKKWREQGFAPLNEALIRQLGLYDKSATPAVISVLAKIRRGAATEGIDGAHDFVESSLAKEDEYTQLIELLKSMYGNHKDVKDALRDLSVFPLAAQLEDIRSKWTKLNSAVRTTWPQDDGTNAATAIEGVLFYQPTEATAEPELDAEEEPATNGPSTGEIKVLRQYVEQLDEFILPQGSTPETFATQLRQLGIEQAGEKIRWEKLEDLIEINHAFNGKILRSKLKKSGESEEYATVYYVSVFEFNGRTFAVAETPETRNATYVIDEAHSAGTWREMLTLDKRQVRELGGKQMIHSTVSPYGPKHQDKIIDHILKAE